MWIKSQRKNILIEADNIELREKTILVITKRVDMDAFLSVGDFKTEEAARKEFENIEDAIINNKNFYEIGEDK